MRSRIQILAVSTVLVSLALMATSAGATTTWGLRAGFSSNPDQFIVGGQADFSPIAKNLYIVPSGLAGFGDNAFTLSFDGDLQYRFHTSSGIRPYAGGGLSVYWINPDFGDSQTNLGVNLDGGLWFGKEKMPMFVDAKAGLTNEVPDWKFAFGIMFH
jgi:hypothetical protein